MSTIYTGGATGADRYWTEFALYKGYTVRVQSFRRHDRHLKGLENDPNLIIDELTDIELKLAENDLLTAARAMKLFMPTAGSVAQKYLLRDGYIVRNSEAVFAIGYRAKDRKGLGIEGGTGWGCEMFYHIHKNVECPMINLWFYDQDDSNWYRCARDGTWYVHESPPTISHIFQSFQVVGLIGSRKLKQNGFDEIQKVFTF